MLSFQLSFHFGAFRFFPGSFISFGPGNDSSQRSVVSSSTSAGEIFTLASSDFPLNVRRLRKGPSTSGQSSAEILYISVPRCVFSTSRITMCRMPSEITGLQNSSTTPGRSSIRGLLRFTRRPGGSIVTLISPDFLCTFLL